MAGFSLVAVILATVAPAASASADPLSSQALFSDLVHYADLDPWAHLTGSTVDARTQRWIRAELANGGLQTGVDGYNFYGFTVRALRLTVAGHRYMDIAALYYSGVTGPVPRRAQLVYAGLGTPAEVSDAQVQGKIAVIDVSYKGHGNALDPTLDPAFQAIEHAGAVGMIAVTEGPQDYPVNQDVDSRAGLQSLPTIFVGKQSGQEIIAAAEAHESASLLLNAAVGRRCTTNSWAILPGQDPNRYVVIGTPVGAWTPAASERGPGVAILLGLARHYAALPQSERPLTLVFAALGGHELGYLGLPTLMAAHPDWFSHADAYVHVGASLAAVQQIEQPDGSVTTLSSGDPSRRLYVSENPLLMVGVQDAFAQADQPLGFVKPSVFDPGEQSYAYHAGIPIVAESGASYYFHTAGDEPTGVGLDLLQQQAAAFASSIDYVTGLSAGSLLAANATAAQLGANQNPNPTPTGGGTEQPAYEPHLDPACASRGD